MVSGIFLLIAMAWWIRNDKQYLDESTKWLYADEKSVQVFALYGIGDGTEATPLYASGGKAALSDHQTLMAAGKEFDYGFNRGAETLNRVFKTLRDKQRKSYGSVFASEEGKALKAEWGVPESYVGIGHCVLGYRSGEYPKAKARKDGFVIRV